MGQAGSSYVPPPAPANEPDAAVAAFRAEVKDLHAVLVATRNLEIGLFWQRANYFLVLNSALAVGFFNLKEPTYAFAFVILGVVASVLWLLVCAGGKYWQTRWEYRLMQFESSRLKDLDFFAAQPDRIRVEVERGLHLDSLSGLKRWLYGTIVLRGFSVSYSMMLLAAAFVLGWVVVGVMRLFA